MAKRSMITLSISTPVFYEIDSNTTSIAAAEAAAYEAASTGPPNPNDDSLPPLLAPQQSEIIDSSRNEGSNQVFFGLSKRGSKRFEHATKQDFIKSAPESKKANYELVPISFFYDYYNIQLSALGTRENEYYAIHEKHKKILRR